MFSIAALLFIIFFMLVFGGMVLSRDVKAKSNRLFFAWVITASLWIVAVYLEEEEFLNHVLREFLLRFDFAVAILAAAFLAVFVLNFPKKTTELKHDFLIFVPAFVLALLSFSHVLVGRVIFDADNQIGFEENWGYLIYGLVLVAYFMASFSILLRKYFRSKEPLKGQIRVIFIGLLLTLFFAVTFSLFFQNILPKEAFRFSYYSFAFFVASVFYAIVKHEFLHIRLIVVELLLMGILASLLSQVIIAQDALTAVVALITFSVTLVLGYMLVGSVYREIQHRRELELLSAKLAKANNKLKELDQTKTTFLSVASHQLRTPLAVAKGYLTTLERGMLGKLAPKQLKAVHTLAKSNNELVALVNELLDLSRIESGRLVTEVVDVDLLPIVDEIFAYFQPKAQEKKLKFVWQRPKGKLVIKADPERVKEVVKNFIDNGLKYTEQGTVTVSAGRDNGRAYYRVADTGYGMTKEDISHLFEKFASGSASKKVKMTSGFGLFVVKNIVEAMGGSVSGQSAGPGQGSVFEARFKLVK